MRDKVIYALGFFDGVHLGHQALLIACRHLARRTGCIPGAVTFTTHPEALTSGHAPRLLNSTADRNRLLLSFGQLHTLLELPFDETLRNQPWQDFLEDLLKKDAAGFVCGDDFRFGFRGEGNADLLAQFCRERGLDWAVVPEQLLDGQRISSTHIRSLLENGQAEEANRFLGHAHLLSGVVVAGQGLGHTIGIPTANLQIPEGVLLPKNGVYACTATVDGKTYPAVTNIGFRPTVDGQTVTVEPWLLDFSGDLYGKALSLSFHSYLRAEEKFPSLDALKAQIQKDAAKTRQLLKNTL